jgi:hypothetical protein
MKRTLTICVLCLVLCSCFSTQPRQGIHTSPTSQPAEPVQQVAGQVAVGMQAKTDATGVAGNLTGYNSEFGVGPAIVVALALVGQGLFFFLVCAMLIVLLTRMSKQSHEREMARLGFQEKGVDDGEN